IDKPAVEIAAGIEQRADVFEIAQLGPRQQGAQLLREQLASGVDEDAGARLCRWLDRTCRICHEIELHHFIRILDAQPHERSRRLNALDDQARKRQPRFDLARALAELYTSSKREAEIAGRPV